MPPTPTARPSRVAAARPAAPPPPATIHLERYAAAVDLAARAATELALLAGSTERIAAQLQAVTAERDALAGDLAEARLLLEALAQADTPATTGGDPPLEESPPVTSPA